MSIIIVIVTNILYENVLVYEEDTSVCLERTDYFLIYFPMVLCVFLVKVLEITERLFFLLISPKNAWLTTVNFVLLHTSINR